MTSLKPLPDTAALEAAIAESRERPVFIFKHSRSCGISCEAYDEVHAHIADAAVEASYTLITVQSHRRVSDEATARLGIRHETPQVILLRDGVPVWNASHFRITAGELTRVLSQSTAPKGSGDVPLGVHRSAPSRMTGSTSSTGPS
jgi:bacillithiol system protein YtxJ